MRRYNVVGTQNRVYIGTISFAGRNMSDQDDFFKFFCYCVVGGLAMWGFFNFSEDAKLKRMLYPFCTIIFCGLFLGFGYHMFHGSQNAMIMMVPAVLLIAYWNIKRTKFCNHCGATLLDPAWSGDEMQTCPKCREKLSE